MPRGPRRNLRPVADNTSQPRASTSIGSCPTAWHASSSRGTPAARVSRPISATGLMSPLCAGAWTTETSFTRSSSMLLQRRDVELAVLVVGHDLDDGAGAVGDLLQRDPVRRVLGPAREDPVAGREPERVERHVPRPRRVLDNRDLVARAADEPGECVIRVLPGLAPFRGRFVAADLGLAQQVPDDGVDAPRPAGAPSRRCSGASRGRSPVSPPGPLDVDRH